MSGADGTIPVGDDGGPGGKERVPAAVYTAMDLLERYCKEDIEVRRSGALERLLDLRRIVTAAGGQ